MKKSVIFPLVLTCVALAVWTSSASAAIRVFTQLAPISNPTDGDFYDAQFSSGTDSTTNELTVSYRGVDESAPDQIFSGSASAEATADTWRFNLSLGIQSYLRKNYVYSTGYDLNGDPYRYVATAGVSAMQLGDEVTISGGTGVYNLNYILGVEGLLTADSSSVGINFAAQLAMPEGTGTLTSYSFSPGQDLPETITLSYADLPFGGPVNPMLTIGLFASILPLATDQVPDQGNELMTGSVLGQFGSTVRLLQMTATDSDGNLIPNLTLYSTNGYQYPTDHNNLRLGQVGPVVPEPTTLAIWGTLSGLGLIAARRRKAA